MYILHILNFYRSPFCYLKNLWKSKYISYTDLYVEKIILLTAIENYLYLSQIVISYNHKYKTYNAKSLGWSL